MSGCTVCFSAVLGIGSWTDGKNRAGLTFGLLGELLFIAFLDKCLLFIAFLRFATGYWLFHLFGLDREDRRFMGEDLP